MEYLSDGSTTQDIGNSNCNILDNFYSVQFSIDGRAPLYQFRIKNITPDGRGILIGQKSAVLSKLKMGEELDMTYCPCGVTTGAKELRTKVVHVSHHTEGKYEGHVAIGLSVIDSD